MHAFAVRIIVTALAAPLAACSAPSDRASGAGPSAESSIGPLAAPGSVLEQTALVPIGTLIENHQALALGSVVFDNFALPQILPLPVGALGEFNDIAARAAEYSDGSVSLSFVAVDPLGQPSPLVTSPSAGGEAIRLIRYSFTVTDPALRVHSLDLSFGAGLAVTGDSGVIHGAYAAEPVPNVYDSLLFELSNGTLPTLRTAGMPSADGSDRFDGAGGVLMPGGNLTTYTLASEFGLTKGHRGFEPGATLDSVTASFSLVDAASPVPPVDTNLATVADGFAEDGLIVNDSGIGMVLLTDYAQEGGAHVTLASSNPSALQPPASVSVPQGYRMLPFQIGDATVDAPTALFLSAAFNGRTVSVPYTAQPSTPLALLGLQALGPITAAGATLVTALNRVNFSAQSVELSSSNPALAPVPPTLVIPAFTTPGDFRATSIAVPFEPVPVDTPVTFSATLNGITQTTTLTLPATTDNVQITRAELTVKTGTLRVSATSTTPRALLTLFDAATGARIGDMLNAGSSGGVTKYTFQGSTGPVLRLRLDSSFGGSTTAAVAQK